MNLPYSARVAAAFIVGAMLAPVASAGEWWVAPSGSDHNPGTSEKPFGTLPAALRHVRNLRRLNDPAISDGAHIRLRGGIYFLAEPVIIRAEDSGSPNSPTIIEAAANEHPVLSGAVSLGSWTPLVEPTTGLPESARTHVWVAPIPPFNGQLLTSRTLWIGDRKATRARTPNEGTMAQLKTWDRANETAGIPANLVSSLAQIEGLEATIEQQWEIGILRVQSLQTDQDVAHLNFQRPESRLEFAHPWPQPMLPPEGGGAFFLSNRVEFLDQAGEWYADTGRSRLLYWPRAEEDLKTLPAYLPALETLVEIAGTLDQPVTHVIFRGIQFEHTTWLRPSAAGHIPLQLGMYLTEAYKLSPKGTPDWHGLDNQAWVERPPAAVSVHGAKQIAFERCRFEHLAMNGLDCERGVSESTIEGCLFRDIGGNAVVAGYFSDDGPEAHLPYRPSDERELCSRIRIANNLVSDAANEDWGCAGIAVGFAREIAVEHNEVRDCSYTGMSVGWGWTRTANAAGKNRVFANWIHHIATRLCDTAGIYTLSAQPGTEIAENVVDAITMSPYVDRPEHWFYLYLDEGSSDIHVHDNWCPAERFMKNANGPGNRWENNGPMVSEEIKKRAGIEAAFRAAKDAATPSAKSE